MTTAMMNLTMTTMKWMTTTMTTWTKMRRMMRTTTMMMTTSPEEAGEDVYKRQFLDIWQVKRNVGFRSS